MASKKIVRVKVDEKLSDVTDEYTAVMNVLMRDLLQRMLDEGMHFHSLNLRYCVHGMEREVVIGGQPRD